MRQTAEEWAEEAIAKYGAGAIAWLGRWKFNYQGCPAVLRDLDRAIEIVRAKEDAHGK